MKYLFLLLSSLAVYAQDSRETFCPPVKEITPNAAPRAKDGAGMFAAAEFLYWTAHEDHLEYAQSKGNADRRTNGAVLSPQGQTYSLGWKWRPGFRAAAGYSFCHDGWVFSGEYTWFQTKSAAKTPFFTKTNPALLDPFWLINGEGFDMSSSSAAWRLRLDVLDLALSRSFFVSPHLHLRPHVGLKGAIERQSMKVRDLGFGSSDLLTTRNRQRSAGLGMRAGMDAVWQLAGGFGLTADLALTALWEQFHCTRFDNELDSGTLSSFRHASNHFHTVKPVIEWMLGLKWETWARGGRTHVAWEAGWEQQLWFSQNQFIHFSNPGPSSYSGDLVLQGLTAKTRVDF